MNRVFWFLMAAIGASLVLLVVNHAAGRTFGIENNDFAQMVKLAAFGLVAAGGLLVRRLPFASAARSLALWVIVALVLVGGYQYRFELQDVASRISAGLVPGSPISTVDAQGREAVYIERAPGGHYEARALVNGTAVPVVVDTGASATVLTAADASRIGLDPEALTYWVTVSTANGQTRAARAEVREIAIGAIARRDVTVLVAQPGALEQSLLGMNFIGSLSGFDMRGDRLILRD